MKKTIADYPELVEEWHPIKNGDLTPNDVKFGSAKKCWWICSSKKHEWQCCVNQRTRRDKTGCPYCSGNKICIDNCLATVYPELAKEWHPTKNGNLTPKNIVAGTGKKIWWKCSVSEFHEWAAVPNDRATRHQNGCPYCANRKVCEDNCLATVHPELAREWHPAKNGILTPKNIVVGYTKKVWWICRANNRHEWQAAPSDRFRNKIGCPYCMNRKVCEDNCLATVHPELVKEWHPTKNGNLTPKNIVAGYIKKVWWICSSKKHEWQCCVNQRTGRDKTGCPYCNESKGEKEVARALDELNVKYIREYTFEDCKHINKLRFDFAVCVGDNFKIIEYHGIQHYKPFAFGSKTICKHKNLKKIQKRDKIKRKFCKTAKIPLLEISYKDFDKIEEQVKKFLSEE